MIRTFQAGLDRASLYPDHPPRYPVPTRGLSERSSLRLSRPLRSQSPSAPGRWRYTKPPNADVHARTPERVVRSPSADLGTVLCNASSAFSSARCMGRRRYGPASKQMRFAPGTDRQNRVGFGRIGFRQATLGNPLSPTSSECGKPIRRTVPCLDQAPTLLSIVRVLSMWILPGDFQLLVMIASALISSIVRVESNRLYSVCCRAAS